MALTDTQTASYGANQAAIDSAWTNATNQINAQRSNLNTQYGGSLDAQGNFQIDNSNPYGAVQQLRLNQGLDLNSNASSQFARGLGQAGFGLAGQQESLMRAGDRASQFSLLNQAQQGYTGLAGQQSAADSTHSLATTANGIDAANNAALNDDFTPATQQQYTLTGPGSVNPNPAAVVSKNAVKQVNARPGYNSHGIQ